MKLNLPPTTITAVLATGLTLSRAQSVSLAMTVPAPDPVVKEKSNVNQDERSIHLRAKLKAKLALRKSARRGDVHLVKTDKECKSDGVDEEGDSVADVGILECGIEELCRRGLCSN